MQGLIIRLSAENVGKQETLPNIVTTLATVTAKQQQR